MDIGRILFSPNGRIGRNDYWVGILILVGANLFLTWLPFVGALIWFGLIYVGAVIAAKRLHDAGKTGWLHLIPWALSFALVGFGVLIAGGAVMGSVFDIMSSPGGFEALDQGDLSDEQVASLFGGGFAAVGGMLLFGTLSTLVWVVYTIWVGLLAPDEGANRYGPAPGEAVAAQAASDAAGPPPSDS